MKWWFPAKTFLLGEYAALQGGSAIIMTTRPCFEVSLSESPELIGIHPESPAGKWWNNQGFDLGLDWYDPYLGKGGFGASSAQFLGAYQASLYLHQKPFFLDEMIKAYESMVFANKGLKPSGYDVIAQSMDGYCYINRKCNLYKSLTWPFSELSCLLIHTNKKVPTHLHLEQLDQLPEFEGLSGIVDVAKSAFLSMDSKILIKSINEYHEALVKLHLVTSYSLNLIEHLKKITSILAIKGCGALGADVVLIIANKEDKNAVIRQIQLLNLQVIADENDLFVME